MLSSFTSLAVLGSAALLQYSTTEAHQVVYIPSPTWTRANSTSTERRVLWNPLSFLEKEGIKTQENFTQYQVDNNYASLRDFMEKAKYKVSDGADQACGWTDPKGIPQQIPEDGTMRTSGYTHDGPCEIYMGDKLALSYLNCHESITEQTFKLDYSACGDSCILYWYWLGVRHLKGSYSWQVYKECIPLYSGSGGGDSTPGTTNEVVMLSSFTSLAVLGSATLLQYSTTEAHQVVYIPSPTWTRANSTSTERRVLWNPLSFLEKEGIKTQENFTQYQVDNNYASLRDFMEKAKYSVTDGADQACGWTDPKGIPQQIPEDGTMRTSGYTHDGPCEIYMGDKLALSYLNCHESITEQTFKLDYSACGDSCILYWYWLGVRHLKGSYSWQIYKECIPLYSGSGGSTTATTTTAPTIESSSTASTAGEADTDSSQNSSPTTEAPTTESTDAPTTESTDAPEAVVTEAPSADVTTPTPATTEKCNASRKRIRA
ncbi:hypothetical protein BBJ29_009056 [Phytophthora kernoviae]|uniref:Uncharacterized protein n=1 Tax=Phytophthora kernoviae TaxID=325452 RepID=A0A3F2RUX4_9STRA|nr:hypothetical protein BBJ29_009056 [Phytophthora kernoviae]RLN64749.1 hypothetical protein BBP00_00003279 [Phytophthora kernoviae]